MRRLFGIFAQRWFISLLGVAALAVLIWYAGPLVEFSDHAVLAGEQTRLVVILVLFGLWLLNVIRRQLTFRLTNAQLVDELIGARKTAAPVGPADEEIALLRERLEGALGTLKKARLGEGRGRQYLYQLPWYIIIGPPGCGKTTALRNSGIRFPLAEEMGAADIRGVGGTRNCDWFFTDEAVLLDTAGRYATQDSDAAADSAAWLGFLDLLKKYRKRRPINGVLVAVSVPELLDQGETGRALHARVIRQRLQELHAHFNIRFPVYVLLTKCDLLPGFMEFFDDLDREDRAQVWGVTFPEECIDESRNVVERLSPELELIERQLHEQLLDRMQRESSSKKRPLIFGFPQQFAALKPVVDGFLKDVFRSSRFESDTLLRGVYFVSGTQEGTPIDRLLGSLSESFGLSRSAESRVQDTGRSYFITRLLRDVVFKESGLAGTNLRFERRMLWLQYGAYAGVVLALCAGALAWYLSYSSNVDYVEQVQRKAEEAKTLVEGLGATQTGVLEVLAPLNAVRDLPGGYSDRYEGVSLTLPLNLDQRPKLGVEAEETYRRILVRQFLPRVLLHMESRLRDSSASFDERYETLKAYRMFADTEHFDREFLRDWVSFLWEEAFRAQMTAELAGDARGHLEALLDLFDEQASPVVVQLNEQLVDRVSGELSRVSVAEQAYGRIKRSSPMRGLAPFDPLIAAGTEAPLVLNRVSGMPMSDGVPGVFTRRGYGVFLKTTPQITDYLSSEQWVFGAHGSATRVGSAGDVARDVGQLYAKEYVAAWRGLLADIEIASFSNIPRAVEMLNILSNPGASPMVRLLRAVEQETSLALDVAGLAAPSGKTGALLQGARELISQLRGDGGDAAADLLSQRTPAATVEREFNQLNGQVRGLDGAPAPIERTLGLLNDLWVASNTLQSTRGGELMSVARQQVAEAIGRVDLEAARQPEPIARWLKTIATNTRRVSIGGVQAELNAIWRSTGDSLCRQGISGRYPIVRGAENEIALDDFARFFGPDGVMDRFFKQHLKDFVDTTTRPWRPRPSVGAGPSIPSPTLEQFRRADVIRRTFFVPGGSSPQIEFELSPITMDADIASFVLNLEGQIVSYRHTPEPPSPLRWPGEGLGQVSIQRTLRSGQTESDAASGPWAWFRLLDRAAVTSTSVRERLNVVFTLGERQISYQLRARSVLNAFRLQELERFQCPSRF